MPGLRRRRPSARPPAGTRLEGPSPVPPARRRPGRKTGPAPAPAPPRRTRARLRPAGIAESHEPGAPRSLNPPTSSRFHTLQEKPPDASACRGRRRLSAGAPAPRLVVSGYLLVACRCRRAARQFLAVEGKEIDRVDVDRREAPVARYVRDDAADEREQQARTFDHQERVHLIFGHTLDVED